MNVQSLYRLDAMGTVLKKLSIKKRWELVERKFPTFNNFIITM
jgi:hypothetical protein